MASVKIWSDFRGVPLRCLLSEIIEAIKQSANEIHPRFVPKIDETACPAELAELCDQCWAVDPAKRPNMVKVRANLKELGKQL